MTQGHQWATLGFVLCLGLGAVCWVASASDKDEVPPASVSHIGPNDTPVYSMDKVGEIDEEFQLIHLPDGHDYWFYRDRGGDRGYAAMAHSPECGVCVSRTTRQGEKETLPNGSDSPMR